jgi:anti-sigma-K factor RskA
MSEIDHERHHDELAPYLLGALEPGEEAALEGHVATCEECRDELERLRPVVQALPESVERVEPSPRLRSRVMAEVRADAAAAPARGGSAADDGRRSAPRRRSFLLRPAVGLAAVVLIVAGVVAYAISGGDSGDRATTVVAGKAPGVTASMVREGDSGTLHLAHLHRLSPDEALQAWVQRGERVEAAGPLFVPHRDGTATAPIEDMRGVSVVMVTAEPRGGSALPTSKPLVSVSAPQ